MNFTSNDDLLFGIMPARSKDVLSACRGYDSTHVSLVGLDNQSQPVFLGAFDDPGIYYLVPKIAHFLQLDAGLTLTLVLVAVLLLGAIALFFGMVMLTGPRFNPYMSGAIISVCAAYFALKGDVYLFNFLAVSFIPLAVYCLHHFRGRYAAAFVLICMIEWYANYFRAHSGTVFFIFMIAYVLFNITLRKAMFFAYTVIFFTFIIPRLDFTAIGAQRNAWFVQHTSVAIDESLSHPLWHSVYIGLGFLENKYRITYNDQVAIDYVNARHPNTLFCGKLYEQTLRQAWTRIVTHDVWFALKVYGAKMLVCIACIVALLNVALFKCRKRLLHEPLLGAFLPALWFSIVAPILVMPRLNYLSSTIALCMLFWLFYLHDDVQVAHTTD